MKTPYLDKLIDDLQNHIESVEATSYAGIPETRAELAEYEAIKQSLTWVNANESLPPINTEDDFKRKNKISVSVLCYSKTWGKRFGEYFYDAGFWSVVGVTSSHGVEVDYWIEIANPTP